VVKDVDVVEAHAAEALVQTGEKIFAGTPIAIRPGPHGVAGLGGDDELVTMRAEVLLEDAAEIGFGGAGRRPVVVGEIEVGDAEIESAQDDVAADGLRRDVAEVLPEAERDAGQHDSAPAAAAINHSFVAGIHGRGGW
jgi:hypothetical protein